MSGSSAGSSFVHLHNHTEYSMLDGAAKITPMLAEVERLGMPAVGMTDHGNMFGASEFYNSATKAGIKPIIGVEAYIAPGSRFDTRRILWGDPSQKADDVSGSGSYTHLTMMAENATGLRNLFKLSSHASFEGQLSKWSRMDAELIAEHAEGCRYLPAWTRPPWHSSGSTLRTSSWRRVAISSTKVTRPIRFT